MARTTFRRDREGVSRFAEEFLAQGGSPRPDRADAALRQGPGVSFVGLSVVPERPGVAERAVQAAILAVGLLLWVVSRWYPADMPVLGPYDFSASIYLATTFTAFWFLRGLARSTPAERPASWRTASFLAGLGLLYAVVQTGFEYPAQRMFFMHRLQHMVLHHTGPVLIGLSMAGPVILRGAPAWVQALTRNVVVRRVYAVVQHPLPATVLFSGLLYFWLYPPVHIVTMLNRPFYEVMNWSMALDGILFWALVLDTRPTLKAGVSFGTRAVLSVFVMFPEMILGALITFATRDLFPYYAYCGRYFPSVSALADQQIGGIIIWIPPSMMSVVGLVVVLWNMRKVDEVAAVRRR